MKYIIFIITLLLLSIPCAAEYKIPSIEHFMVGSNIKDTKKTCLNQKDEWTREPDDPTLDGKFYKCDKFTEKPHIV